MGLRGLHSTILWTVLCCGSYSFAANVEIDVTLSPAGSYKATTKKVTGSAWKTADGGVAAENVAIDMRTLSTGIGLRDKHTKEHLMVGKFPQAKLVKASGKDGKGTATIEIKGMKVDVAGTYKVDGNTLHAEFPMQLSNLEIKDVRYMGVGVKDTVKVHLEIPLTDAPQRAAASAKK
ncbi:MAG: YceI family protein [Bdellovibrionales bacterium]|nr:YceI family protein [Bdellovibrionales bacterium]